MDDNTNNIDVSAVIDRLGHGCVVNFDLANVRDMELWSGPIEGPLRARALSALIDEKSSVELIAACANSIAAISQWQELLGELLLTSEISPSVMDIASRVLRQRMPNHPLAALSTAPSHAGAVYDAIGDGESVRFRMDAQPASNQQWIFFDLEDVVGHFATVEVHDAGGEVKVPFAQLNWLDPRRTACSAFVVVA